MAPTACGEKKHVFPPDALEALRAAIRRRWGGPGVLFASAVEPVPVEVTSSSSSSAEHGALPFGCAALDGLLPFGGVPRGRLTEISGAVSSGKTSLAFALVERTLRADEERPEDLVAWVDPWKAFHASTAAGAGVPLQRLLLVRPPQVAEVLRAAETLVRTAALALVVIDAVGLREAGATAALFRLARLAQHAGTAVVLITDRSHRTGSLGSAIALRLCIERRSYCFEPEPRPPFDLAGYRVEVQVSKTRHGPVGEPRLLEVRSREGLADLELSP